MSSINPVLLLPGALEARGEAHRQGVRRLADAWARASSAPIPAWSSAIEGPGLDRFVERRRRRRSARRRAADHADPRHPQGLLRAASTRLAGHASVDDAGARRRPAARYQRPGRAVLDRRRDDFLADPALQEEVFGAASLVVRCRDAAELPTVARRARRPADRDAAPRRRPTIDDARARCCRCSSARPAASSSTASADRRRGGPRDGPWRPVPVDLGRPQHLGRHAWRSTASCARSATRTCPTRCCRRH